MQRLIILIFVFCISASGCVSVPDTLTVENRQGDFGLLPRDYLCHKDLVISGRIPSQTRTVGQDAPGFSMLSWNIQKENRAGWESDFVRLAQNTDILIIQEAFLTEDLRRLLNRGQYYWHLVTAFEYQSVKVGVLTATTIEPDFVCPLRAAEPLIRLPKTILITRYPLSNTPRSLMVANIHMINFAPDPSVFYDQARQMSKILVDHQGPMILSGDFNTWSKERFAIIADMAGRLKLEPVDFKTDLARKVFGHTVDHVYYRGLTLEEALVVEVTSSDHNPMRVRFKLNDEN
jgi:endonuclease/exonuclease/phosphatase (EEP) superfamily protein YafD